MKSRFLAFAALALACVLAAGGGAYLAVRQTQAGRPAQATDQQAPVQPRAAAGTPAALVTTPPSEADTAPSASLPPAAAQAPAPSPTTTRESTKAARRDSAGDRAARQARVADQAAGSQADAAKPPAAAGAADANAQQTPPPPDPVVAPPPEPPAREFVEVTVPSETVLALQVQTAVTSETARIEDRVDARVTRDVRVGDRVAIPAGSQAIGSVVQVERGGKLKTPARVAIRFNSLILPDGTRLPLTAEAVHREGPSPTDKSAARIGGATIGGAILGAILGGGKGAAIGGAIGAGGGAAATMASDREPATLAAGSIVNIRLMSPVTVTLER